MLIIEASQLVDGDICDESHRGLIRKNPRRKIDKSYQHAVIHDICRFVYLKVAMNDLIKFLFQGERRLGDLIVFIPFIELLAISSIVIQGF